VSGKFRGGGYPERLSGGTLRSGAISKKRGGGGKKKEKHRDAWRRGEIFRKEIPGKGKKPKKKDEKKGNAGKEGGNGQRGEVLTEIGNHRKVSMKRRNMKESTALGTLAWTQRQPKGWGGICEKGQG